MKHRIRITKKKKLDYYAKSYRGKNTSVIHDAIHLIQLLLSISSSEAILSHSEWPSVSHRVMENFGYNESTSRYFVITETPAITGTPDITK